MDAVNHLIEAAAPNQICGPGKQPLISLSHLSLARHTHTHTHIHTHKVDMLNEEIQCTYTFTNLHRLTNTHTHTHRT